MLAAALSVVLTAAAEGGDARPVLVVFGVDANDRARTLDAPEVKPLLERFRIEEHAADQQGFEALRLTDLHDAPSMAVLTPSGLQVDRLFDWQPAAFAADLEELADLAVGDPSAGDARGLFLAARQAQRDHDPTTACALFEKAAQFQQPAGERAAYLSLQCKTAGPGSPLEVERVERYLDTAHRMSWRLNALAKLTWLSLFAHVDAAKFDGYADAIAADLAKDPRPSRLARLELLRRAMKGQGRFPQSDPFTLRTTERPADTLPPEKTEPRPPTPMHREGSPHLCINAPFVPQWNCEGYLWIMTTAGAQWHAAGSGIDADAVLDVELQLRREKDRYQGFGLQVDLGFRHQAQWMFEPGVGASASISYFELDAVVGPSLGFDGRSLGAHGKLSLWFVQHLAAIDVALQSGSRPQVLVGFRIDLGVTFPMLLVTPWKVWTGFSPRPTGLKE